MNTQDSGSHVVMASELAIAIQAVKIERIRADIEALCATPRNSGEDAVSHSGAAQYIAECLSKADCTVSNQEFTIHAKSTPRPGLNVIGALEPSAISTGSQARGSSSALLIGAHYDTVPQSPGADDNASGVAVMLETARALGGIDRCRTVIFAAFDAEESQPEVGLHGSSAYVQSLKESSATRTSVAYILEMVGFSAPAGEQKIPRGLQLMFPRAFDRLRSEEFAGNSVVAISDHRSQKAGRQFEQAARQVAGGVPVLPVEVPRWMPVPHNLRRSDHAPFWAAGIPAVMIGDTANFRNPNYHRPTDTPDTLDYRLIGQVTRTMVALAAKHTTFEESQRRARVKLR